MPGPRIDRLTRFLQACLEVRIDHRFVGDQIDGARKKGLESGFEFEVGVGVVCRRKRFELDQKIQVTRRRIKIAALKRYAA